jgi:N-acetyl-anhydromuramyl-L-alanine amidase AmpD
MLPLQAVGAHAPGYNQSGIGVAFIGDFRTDEPSPEQIESGIAVCVALLRQHQLTPATVKLLGHDETRPVPKLCPGPCFPLDELRQRIASAFA